MAGGGWLAAANKYVVQLHQLDLNTYRELEKEPYLVIQMMIVDLEYLVSSLRQSASDFNGSDKLLLYNLANHRCSEAWPVKEQVIDVKMRSIEKDGENKTHRNLPTLEDSKRPSTLSVFRQRNLQWCTEHTYVARFIEHLMGGRHGMVSHVGRRWHLSHRVGSESDGELEAASRKQMGGEERRE
ncbi:hypothetical protein MUK42_33328 [Musa troglodytarum]|uniref:Uncharacterized protein n=1 Tax=Musa troglodytarum TaxID=320322 RepID=A0A9E7F913_9LILI|nr:hypothetical protein MUK42_33328 [Musa troglodytarum]